MHAPDRANWPRPISPLWFPRLPPLLVRNLPWIALILLSITFAEFLTGSTFVLLPLLDPISAAFLVGLYGAGVLLVREASVRWRKGWPTVLLLGAAYGIAEEGLGTKTFFGPIGVGHLGTYGHWLGVNWVWATELALFHAIFSIALPIAVVEIVFPATQGVPFLRSRRSLAATVAAFLLTVTAMYFLFNPTETPSGALVLASIGAIAGLVVLARRVPASLGGWGIRSTGAPLPVRPALLGAVFVWGFFGIAWLGSSVIPISEVVTVGLIAWCLLFGVEVVRHRETFQAPGTRVAFIWGALTLSLVLASVETIFGDYGAPVVVGSVILLGWRLRRGLPVATSAQAPVTLGQSRPLV